MAIKYKVMNITLSSDQSSGFMPVIILGFTYPDVKYSDEIGSLGVVFDQTGHATAFLAPAGVPVCCEHLDHC